MESGSRREREENKDHIHRKNILEVLTRFVDEYKRWITYGLYGVSVIGGVIAIRSLKLFQQFKRIRDIPDDFVQKNQNIFGIIEKTEITKSGANFGPRLLISHIPIFGKITRSSDSHLPVKIMGVTIEQSQLQQSVAYLETLKDKKVKVKIFGQTEEELLGQCFSKNYGVWKLCVGSSLLEKGFGNVESIDFKSAMFNKSLLNYRNKLNKHERKAEDKKVGIWRKSDSEMVTVMQRLKNMFWRSHD